MPWRLLTLLIVVLPCGAFAEAGATRDDLDAWIRQEVLTDPPVAGTIIGPNEIQSLAAWLPPGYLQEFDFPELEIEIQATADYPPHPEYQAASEKFAGQAMLAEDNSLQNYTAGRPFSDAQIAAAQENAAGFMVAWNQIHRWQYMGYKVDALTMTYVKPVTDRIPADPDDGLHGGGSVTRQLQQFYHRVYLSKLAWLGTQDYRVDVPDSDTQFFKDYMEFLAPFDVKGTSFVVERNLDPHADDQVNIYSPTERRVRRFSAKERADSFMGSEGTLDDFEGFSGRVLDYQWRYLGERRVLYVADTKQKISQGFGPYSRVPQDRWQIRNCYVVELKSVWDGHPYAARVLFIDKQTHAIAYSMIIDYEDRVWKTLHTLMRGPLDPRDPEFEQSVASWRGSFIIDLNSNNSTIVRAMSDTIHPGLKPSQIKRVFSVSNLASGR